MDNILIKELYEQEELLQFKSFGSIDAWEIGQMLVKKGSKGNNITIDITKNRQQLFHYSFDKTSADNDMWVRRKTNVVYRFSHSSFLVGQELKLKNKTIEEAYLIPESEFGAHGGCFPIIIKDTGVIGTITVSGLAQAEDHQLVVDVLKEYLGV
ncbi:MAG: heme-degrading domain-containing protein [Spirochaetaceae bacterium]